MAITVYTELLLNRPDTSKNERKMLNTILHQANHASELTEQILDFSRKSLLRLELLDLGAFIIKTKNLLRHIIPENIQASVELKEPENWIMGDEARLQQILVNLAINARDAMPEGGKITVELSHLTIEEEFDALKEEVLPGKYICMKFSDSGCGIPEKHLPHIFEPFFTTKEVGKGSGLGLAQVYGIVKQHRGYIFVESEFGKGTTFTILFPIAEQPKPEPIKSDSNDDQLGNQETILVVEDNTATQNAIREVLEMLKYHVLCSDNGAEALNIYQQEKIDLVVSDLVMPEIGGMALYEKLRTIDPDVKMVILTGYPLTSSEIDLAEQGILAWVQKPLTVDKIAQTVRSALDA